MTSLHFLSLYKASSFLSKNIGRVPKASLTFMYDPERTYET